MSTSQKDSTSKESAKTNPATPATESDLSEQVQVRFDKLARIRDRKENPYKNGFNPSALASELHSAHGSKSKEELEAAAIPASVAGRIMAIRDFGKASFIRL